MVYVVSPVRNDHGITNRAQYLVRMSGLRQRFGAVWREWVCKEGGDLV